MWPHGKVWLYNPDYIDVSFYRNDELEIIKHWTVDQYIGYITSWSVCQKYLKVNPGSTVLQILYEK